MKKLNVARLITVYYTRDGQLVKPLYSIGHDMIEVRMSDGSNKRFSIYDIVTESELESARKLHSVLPGIENKTLLSRKYIRKKYNKKWIRKISKKLSVLVENAIRRRKALTAADLKLIIPLQVDFSEYKGSRLSKIARALVLLDKHGFKNKKLLSDINNEIRTRNLTKKERTEKREKEKEQLRAIKIEFKPKAAEYLKLMKSEKSSALLHIKQFAKDIFDKHYIAYSLDICNKIAMTLLEEEEQLQVETNVPVIEGTNKDNK